MARAEGLLVVALLAAGRSTRFGEADKLMALLGDRPLIQWAAQAGRTVPAARHLLVTGPGAAFDARALGYELLRNLDPQAGMASSLRIAASAARARGADRLMILLADMPFIRPDHLAGLIDMAGADPARPVFTTSDAGVTQPPALFPAGLFGDLLALEGDKGARGLARTALLVRADAMDLLDVDTPDDLATARAEIRPT